MVDALRKEADLSNLDKIDINEISDELDSPHVYKPNSPVVYSLDVRPIIDAGDHPKDAVLDMADKLTDNECMELISPFPPVPLIEALRKRGFKTTMLPAVDGVVVTYIE